MFVWGVLRMRNPPVSLLSLSKKGSPAPLFPSRGMGSPPPLCSAPDSRPRSRRARSPSSFFFLFLSFFSRAQVRRRPRRRRLRRRRLRRRRVRSCLTAPAREKKGHHPIRPHFGHFISRGVFCLPTSAFLLLSPPSLPPLLFLSPAQLRWRPRRRLWRRQLRRRRRVRSPLSALFLRNGRSLSGGCIPAGYHSRRGWGVRGA